MFPVLDPGRVSSDDAEAGLIWYPSIDALAEAHPTLTIRSDVVGTWSGVDFYCEPMSVLGQLDFDMMSMLDVILGTILL